MPFYNERTKSILDYLNTIFDNQNQCFVIFTDPLMIMKINAFINTFNGKQKWRCLYFVTGILFFTTALHNLRAQTPVADSLKAELKAHPAKAEEIALVLFNLAAQSISSDAMLAQAYVDEIIAVQHNIKNKNITSAAYRVKGITQLNLSQFSEALISLNKALEIDVALKSDFGQVGDLNSIGLVYMTQSNFREALKYYLRSLEKAEKLNNPMDVAAIKSNIGIIYTEMGDYQQAMQTYESTLKIFRENKHYPGIINILTNIGVVYFKTKNIQEAIKYSSLSLHLADSVNDTRARGRENGNLSAYYNQLGKYDLALEYGLKALAINKEISSTKSLGFNEQNVSAAYLKKGNLQLAKQHGLQAFKIGSELEVGEIKKEASLGLSEVYEALAMPDSALFYYKKFTIFSDSISNDNNKREVTKMSMKYEFDKTEAVYKQKQLLAEEQLKQQQLELALSIAQVQQVQQLKNLQEVQLQNEKLLNEEKQKQLIIAQNNEKLQSNKVNALSQQQKLDQLELKQVWLYGILALVTLVSILIYLLNLYRLRKLKFKNALQFQEAEQNALKLKHQYQLTESELKSIRSQMNPHFIFNVLNSIESYIMDNDKKMASRLIQKFASLSRLILENSTKSLVTADKEWKALMLYTELEAIRYNHSFTYSFITDEELALQTIFLPPMLIQPLIENAILHGLIVDNREDAHLTVTLKKTPHDLRITVTDNGVGFYNSQQVIKKPVGIKEKSIGLSSIKERIEIINTQYQINTASFTITAGENNSGTIAIVCLPLLYNNENK